MYAFKNLFEATMEISMLGNTQRDGQKVHHAQNQTNGRWYLVQHICN